MSLLATMRYAAYLSLEATSRSRTTKPSKAEPAAEEYRPSVIPYFEILGSKELLSNAGENANKVAEGLNLARRFSESDEVPQRT
jgi:predicted secreted protein